MDGAMQGPTATIATCNFPTLCRKVLDESADKLVMAVETDAEEHLRYIRDVMQRSSEFSAISGIGVMIVGTIGVATSAYTATQLQPSGRWVAVWCVVAVIALVAGTLPTLAKARRAGSSVAVGPGRKFALCLAPALLAGAGLTYGLYQAELFELLPAAWMLIYGAGLMAGGTYSVGNVPVFGGLIMLVGLVALFVPGFGSLLMGVGFGLLHLVMGAIIYRRYGG